MTTTHARLSGTVLLAAANTSDRASAPARSQSSTEGAPSVRQRWAGRVLSGLGVLFLTFDAALKLLRTTPALESTEQLGYPLSVVFPLGVLELALLVLYLVPRTSILGAILWTGYLGGAIATHVRLENPLFSHVLFPIYIAALLRGGLWLRDRRTRALLERGA